MINLNREEMLKDSQELEKIENKIEERLLARTIIKK